MLRLSWGCDNNLNLDGKYPDGQMVLKYLVILFNCLYIPAPHRSHLPCCISTILAEYHATGHTIPSTDILLVNGSFFKAMLRLVT